MARHTFFTDSIPDAGGVVDLDRDQKHHLFKVFRAVVGDEVELLDGRGVRASGIIEADKSIVITQREENVFTPPELHLVFALPRKNQLDLLLKQAAELGVAELHPVQFQRSVSQAESKERWVTLLEEACKQSKNPFLPKIHKVSKLDSKLDELAGRGIPVVFGAIRSESVKGNLTDRAAWVVGPEGGFTGEEESLMRERGALPLNLGPWVLRLETAACAGIAVLRQMMALLFIALIFTGCTPDPAKDPFVRKAERARGKGDYVTSLNFYRRALSRHPESHYIALQMANLCDESLDDPVSALFYYNEFLKFAPENSPYIQSARVCRSLVEKRLLRKLGREESGELDKLRAENARLKRINSGLRHIIKTGKK